MKLLLKIWLIVKVTVLSWLSLLMSIILLLMVLSSCVSTKEVTQSTDTIVKVRVDTFKIYSGSTATKVINTENIIDRTFVINPINGDTVKEKILIKQSYSNDSKQHDSINALKHTIDSLSHKSNTIVIKEKEKLNLSEKIKIGFIGGAITTIVLITLYLIKKLKE